MADASLTTLIRFWTKVDAPNDFQCWVWRGRKNQKGYGRFDDGIPAHRWAYECVHGPIPDGKMILHSCDNPSCVNPKHLRPGTHMENMQDAVDRNRFFKREKCYNAKVTAEIADYIRRNPDKLKLKELAAKFGIANSTASYIRSGKTWTPD